MKTELAKKSNPILNKGMFQQLLASGSLIILIIFFSLASPNFLSFSNIVGILLSTAVVGILALGSTFVIITGGIDLSVGTVMTLSAVMTGVFITFWDMPVTLGILGGILTGSICGLISGVAVSRFKIPPFIATLAMMMIAKGLALIISGTKPIYFNDAPKFTELSSGSIIGDIIPGFNIPNAVIIFFIAAIIGHILLSKTILGRYNYAIGSNEEATRLSGINVKKWKIAIYTITGAFVGLAGVIMAARLNSAQPGLGAGYELEAIAAVVIGGTSLSGGKGTIVGTVIGALIMTVLTNGLRILSVPQEWQTVVVGCVILLAVYMDIVRRK